MADGQALFDGEVGLGHPLFNRFFVLLADQFGKLDQVALILALHRRVIRPVIHCQLDLLLILQDEIGQVVHLFFGILAELAHDESLLEVTTVEVILDQRDRQLAIELRQLQHSILDSVLKVRQGRVRVLVLLFHSLRLCSASFALLVPFLMVTITVMMINLI